MAEESEDQSQKTEEPTHKRLQDARNKGQLANSREVGHWFMILAGTIMIMITAPVFMDQMRRFLARFLVAPRDIDVGIQSITPLIGELAIGVIGILLPTFLVLVAAALASGLIQNGLVIATEQMKPKLEKISILKGFKRMFSIKSVVELLKGLVKVAIVGSVAVALVWPEMDRIEQTLSLQPLEILGHIHSVAIRLMIGVLGVISVIALLDFLFQKMQHLKQMKMSRHEIKEEMKQTEGDPIIRSRLRQIRRERAQQRMMQSVPEASVVITNPTHYAVALKYELDEMAAPVCIAKGIDHIALRIREVALEHDIPIVENPPLSRTLHAAVGTTDRTLQGGSGNHRLRAPPQGQDAATASPGRVTRRRPVYVLWHLLRSGLSFICHYRAQTR
jgi:flagellar biosynthetic protein FlhB